MRALQGALLACGLVAVVLAVNAPTWDYGFVYDDRAVIVDRAPYWEQGWTKFFQTRQWGTGRHAVALSFDLNRTDPLEPHGYHVVNTALAALAAVLVFALGLTLRLSLRAAVLASALFAVHPVHADAVVSLVGRAELLAGIAVLACVVLHARGYPLPAISIPAAAVLFLIGAASKENALALPLLLALYDWLLGPPRTRVATVAPYAAYGLAAVAWLLLASRGFGTLDPITFVDNPLGFMPWYERVPRAAAVLWRYFGTVVLPISLKPDRGYATTMPSLIEGVAGLIGWLIVLTGCWRARRQAPRAVFLTLWFPASFAVTSNVLYAIGTIMAERLVFTPSVGVVLLAGLLFERATAGSRLRRAAATAVASVLTLILAFAYDARARVWASESHYHFVAAVESPSSAKAHYDLGLERARAKDWEAAEAAFRRALAIYPSFGLATYYLANVLVENGRPEEAVAVYESYLEREPDDADARSQLLTLYRKRERPEASILERQLQQGQPEPVH